MWCEEILILGTRQASWHVFNRYRTVKEGERKGTESGVRKAAGDEGVFIPGEGSGLQMRSDATPYRTRRAVTGPLNRMA
jgi:hypothetical protein